MKNEGDSMCSLLERIFSVGGFKRSDGVRTAQMTFEIRHGYEIKSTKGKQCFLNSSFKQLINFPNEEILENFRANVFIKFKKSHVF